MAAHSYVIGIDEVGRGPLAGPVTLCACAVSAQTLARVFSHDMRGIKDSKKLTPAAREIFFAMATRLRREKKINYAVSHVSASVIDRKGIARAIAIAIARCLQKLNISPHHVHIFLDGSLKAPQKFTHQKTIIGGDQSVPIISLASVIAKVTRDRKMTRLAKQFPHYGLEVHKGYGTLVHRRAIQKYGLSALHRRTFCQKFLDK